MNDSPPVVLFDGDCSFCSATVRWTIERDPLARLRFAPLRSASARRAVALADPNTDFDELPDTIVLADENGVHTTSTAVLRMTRHLRFPYPVLRLALLVPRPVRDAAYRLLARNRYRWFGRSDHCPLPPPGFASRFLHEEEG